MGFARSTSIRLAQGVAAAAVLSLALGCGLAKALDNPTTATPQWAGPTGFDTGLAVPARAPSAAMDGAGNVLLAWQRNPGTGNLLWGDVYAASASAWQATGGISSLTGAAQNVKVAVGGNGVFMLAWDLSQGYGDSGVYVDRWAPAAGFDTPLKLSSGYAYAPVVAMNVNGDACVAWTETGPTYLAVKVCRYSVAANAWTAPVQVSASTAASAFSPQVGLDAAGNVMVLWAEAVPALTLPYSLQAARYLAATQAWSAPTSPQAAAADPAYPGALAMTAAGAQLAWAESTDGGSTYQIYARRWTASGDAWTGAAKLVSAAGANAQEPALGLDSSGNALLAWIQFTKPANTTRDLYAAAYTGFSGWQTPAALAAGTPGVLEPALAMNAFGNGALAWRQYDGTHWRIWAARYPPGYGWSTPALIQVDTGGDAVTPAVAVGTALTPFEAVVTWCQPDASGVPHVYANRYQ